MSQYDNVIRMVTEHLQTQLMVPFDEGEVTLDTNLLESGYIDSYGLIELIQQLESTYEIEFSGYDMVSPEIVSAAGVSGIVAAKLSATEELQNSA